MNKIFTLLLVSIFVFTGKIKAQIIPNAGFEGWHSVGGWFDDPDFWHTNNTSILAPSVVKDSNAYQGILSMKVVNATNLVGSAFIRHQLPQHPLGVNVYVKSNIVNADSNCISAFVYYGGSVVDSGKWYNSSAIANWAFTTIPVSQNNINIDSIEISVKSGSQTGTSISVDELGVYFPVGIETQKFTQDWSLFPNPMLEYSFLSFENKSYRTLTLSIYNTLGQLVRNTSNVSASPLKIEKDNLTKGLYLFVLSNNTEIIAKGKMSVD